MNIARRYKAWFEYTAFFFCLCAITLAIIFASPQPALPQVPAAGVPNAYACGPSLGSRCIIGQLRTANLNITTDNIIPIALPPGATKYIVTGIWVANCSVSITTSAGGLYTAASKGGTAIVAAAQTYATCTGTTAMQTLTIAAAGLNAPFGAASLFLNLTTPQGAPATADVYVEGVPIN